MTFCRSFASFLPHSRTPVPTPLPPFRSCASWCWFYPFHYAPFTSDLVNLSSYRVSFRLGQPFLPFQQLLGCLPAASSSFLPVSYRHLMIEPGSPLIHYYPPVSEIKVDMNGKVRPCACYYVGVAQIMCARVRSKSDARTMGRGVQL